MPAIAALTLADGQPTPANHTFSPVTTNGSKARYAERSAAIPKGYFTLEVEVRNQPSGEAANRVIVGINVPTTVDVDGVETVVRNSSGQLILNLSQLSTEQERLDVLAYLASLAGNSTFKTAVQNLEPFY